MIEKIHILYPIFAMFALTAVAVSYLGLMRLFAVKRKAVNPKFYKTYSDYEEPEYLKVASRHVVNLFEVPMLFYVVAILIYITDQVSSRLVTLLWLYVLTRFIHSYIHLTSNVVIWRLRVFVVSGILLLVIWGVFASQLTLTR